MEKGRPTCPQRLSSCCQCLAPRPGVCSQHQGGQGRRLLLGQEAPCSPGIMFLWHLHSGPTHSGHLHLGTHLLTAQSIRIFPPNTELATPSSYGINGTWGVKEVLQDETKSILFFLGLQSLKAEMLMFAAVTFISVTNYHLLHPEWGGPIPIFHAWSFPGCPSCLPYPAGTDRPDFQLWTEVQGGRVEDRELGASLGQCLLLVTPGGPHLDGSSPGFLCSSSLWVPSSSFVVCHFLTSALGFPLGLPLNPVTPRPQDCHLKNAAAAAAAIAAVGR